MDYEKMYKDALERMKYWMDGNTPDEFYDKHEVHTFVFPELAESEDVGIKKEIIHYLEITCNQMTPNQDWDWKNRWLPWIKKQGEHKWKPSNEQIEALESSAENCAYSEYQDCLKELIKQLKKLREE